MKSKTLLSGKKVCYIGPVINSRKHIKGPNIHFYYILKELSSVASDLVMIDVLKLNIIQVKYLLFCDVIWFEYPARRIIGFLSTIISIILNKKLIVRIRDLPVEQERDLLLKKRSKIYEFQIKVIETLIAWKAHTIIISVPGFIKYINPRTSSIIVFPPGVSKEELGNIYRNKKENYKYVMAYAGSLDRGGMIKKLCSTFSSIDGWEFWIAGKGQENINSSGNVKYFGFLSYEEVQKFYDAADAIVIPYPKKEYYNICIPLKIGEVLSHCKPVIITKLASVEEYLQHVDLENNVIFMEDWSKEEIENALKKAKEIEINKEQTIQHLCSMTWELRTKKLISVINEGCKNCYKLEWI